MTGEPRRRQPRVLVIDDGVAYARLLAEQLPEFARIEAGPEGRLADGPAALQWLEGHAGEVDAVLLDVHFEVPEDRLLPLEPGASLRRQRRLQGIAILREIRRRWPMLPVVLLSAAEDLSLADAVHDVSATPVTCFLDAGDADTLRIRLHAAISETGQAVEDGDLLWGRDPAMRTLRSRLAVLAQSGLPVLVEGETGTGKSYLAKHFLHHNSKRRGAFVALDLATVPADLVPAALFGSLRGSYTGATVDRKGAFEEAHGGTLFLDEIQNVAPEVQKQLLAVLQEGVVQPLGSARTVTVDVKIVAASNVPLWQAVQEGRFRRDLYMRLSPATRVEVPPLRNRLHDLPFLLRRMAEQAATKPAVAALREVLARGLGMPKNAAIELVIGTDLGQQPRAGVLELALHKPGLRALAAHDWPGNMRELAMVVENLVTFTLFAAVEAMRAGAPLAATRLAIDTGLVLELLRGEEPSRPKAASAEEGFTITVVPAATLGQVASELERQLLTAIFFRTGGDLEAMAAQLLGDPRRARAVRLRLNQLGLKIKALRQEAGKS